MKNGTAMKSKKAFLLSGVALILSTFSVQAMEEEENASQHVSSTYQLEASTWGGIDNVEKESIFKRGKNIKLSAGQLKGFMLDPSNPEQGKNGVYTFSNGDKRYEMTNSNKGPHKLDRVSPGTHATFTWYGDSETWASEFPIQGSIDDQDVNSEEYRKIISIEDPDYAGNFFTITELK
jgi:hypothetical protein